jgi:hypothetical protein
MTCIEISELNGAVGNSDYFRKSRVAEHEILKVVSRLIQRPIQETVAPGRHECDFQTSQGFLGDVKIWTGNLIKVELQQYHKGIRVPGWYHAYDQLTGFGGLITLNHWHSKYLNQSVYKLRWVPWATIQSGVQKSKRLKSRTGEWCELNPTHGEHYWLGDFPQVQSMHGEPHRAFDVRTFISNPRLQIAHLLKWF